MNPKEVSYSHPQLPLCDTPILLLPDRLPEVIPLRFSYHPMQ